MRLSNIMMNEVQRKHIKKVIGRRLMDFTLLLTESYHELTIDGCQEDLVVAKVAKQGKQVKKKKTLLTI